MPEAFSITAPLLVASVLVFSAVGKLRDPVRAAAGFEALEVHRQLRSAAIVRSHPWVEIILGVLLLVTSGWLGALAATAALALMLAYLWLVVRALRSPVDVDCACFGAWSAEQITGRTVWRNVWFVSLAALALWSAAGAGSVLERIGDSGSWWWIPALTGTAVTVVLVGLRPSIAPPPSGEQPGIAVEAAGDYLRARTPAIPVTFADGSRSTLRELSRARAQLLLFVSEGCGSCAGVIAAVPEWRNSMPQVDVRLVLSQPPDVTILTSTAEPKSIHDLDGWVRESFATHATPSAVLLGADGLLAGGPVVGSEGVPAFVADIQEQLRVAT